MIDVVSLGMLPTEFRNRVQTKENQQIYSDIFNRKLCSFRWALGLKTVTPKFFYDVFKKELCGDLPIKWKQALKEANTLRLENLTK